MDNYAKLLIVRHPLERLLSAYRNKFESRTNSSSQFQQEIGRSIIKELRRNASNESLLLGDDVTFLEFIHYITAGNASLIENDQESFNEHWESINGLCNPCAVHYDYVVNMENIVAESNSVLEKIQASGIRFPERNDEKSARTREKLLEYFDEVPLEQLVILQKIYEIDSQMFGYSF